MEVFANRLKAGDEITGYLQNDKTPRESFTGIVTAIKLKGLVWVKVIFQDDEPILLDPMCLVMINRHE